MPKKGKKEDTGGGKKAEKKLAAKIIEDKTFGLKNKNKSHAVQKYIKGIVDVTKRKVGLDVDKSKEYQEKAEKKKQRQEEAFLNSLYKQVTAAKQQEVPEGVDSKTVLCELFKQGKCELGDKCKFSHDLNIEFNQGTFDIYTDLREIKSKFEKEVNKIAEEKEKKRKNVPQSNIVCKYFLDAVKKKIYGWGWECPNGDTCHYKHYLPKGYILLTNKEKEQEDMTMEEYMDLEEQIDAERERISANGTKVNENTFREWKLKRDEFRNATKDEKEKDVMVSKLTGVQLFTKQADLFKDDENAEDVKMDEIENNVLDDEEEQKDKEQTEEKPRTEEEIIKDLESEMKEIKINEELFKEGGENLDELDQIIDDDDKKEENKPNDENGEPHKEEQEDEK